MNSSFASRGKLAGQYGISKFTGNADQNKTLLDYLKSGGPPREEAKVQELERNLVQKIDDLEKKIWNDDPLSEQAEKLLKIKSDVEKYFDGIFPRRFMTREQLAKVINDLAKNIKEYQIARLEEEIDKQKEVIEMLKIEIAELKK